MSQQYINILLSEGDSIQVIADVEVEVSDPVWVVTDPETGAGHYLKVHVADLLYGAILDKLKGQDMASLGPGKYAVRLMATVVEAPDDDD